MRNLKYKSIIYDVCIILICCFTTVLAQRTSPSLITIESNNKPLREVLQEISKKSNAEFVFSDELVDGKTFACHFERLTLEETIRNITEELNISFTILPTNLIVLYRASDTYSTVSADSITEDNLVALAANSSPFTPTSFTLPTFLEESTPDYPWKALWDGLEGSVELNLLVGKNGNVKKAVVVKSSGHEKLDDAALEFSKKLKYTPATIQEKPIEIWVSRIMHFQLVERPYVPSEYIDRIAKLRDIANQKSRFKNWALRRTLDYHEELSEYLSKKPHLNYNKYIRQFIDPKIYQEWKELWEDWPLHYLIFHDFILRYPDSELKSRAVNSLLYFINKDIAFIEQSQEMDPNRQATKDQFVKAIYRFLENKYPNAMISRMKNGTTNNLVNR